MEVTLESPFRKIIIDAKFYRDITQVYHGSEKFKSGNLYQIYSYLRNLEEDDDNPLNKVAEGLLLYPTVQQEFDQSYMISGHKIRFATVDLGGDWKEIDKRLRELIAY